MADDLQLSLEGMDWLGLVIATVVAQLGGWLWFGPLFGRKWANEMGFDADMEMDGKAMAKGMILFFLGNFLMAYVLWHTIQVWIPSVWAEHLGAGAVEDSAMWMYGMYAALFTWLGFFVPQQFSKISWEQGTWKLFGINSGWDLVRLAVMTQIIAAF